MKEFGRERAGGRASRHRRTSCSTSSKFTSHRLRFLVQARIYDAGSHREQSRSRVQIPTLSRPHDAGVCLPMLPNSGASTTRPVAASQVDRWGGQDLNLRPTDYESAALTD